MTTSVDEALPEEVVVEELEKTLLSSKVRSIIAAMEEAGCPVTRAYFHVLHCNQGAGGGYSPSHGVILCRNHLRTRHQVQSTILHELIHAYDDCRAGPKGLAWDNCEAHACTEVRAASLSGDCDWSQEAWRGNVSPAAPTTWLGYHQRCVERRAALSVSINPHCQGPGCAVAAVHRMLERCIADHSPFDKQPP